ncbi:MAG: SpoIID/LytB domain-containing protein [Defluviitaleaceae bacterium]|nr:SpoIID/LytB domain-containing protein [Defluviitaleaceae bacterium]MCL2262025.1 SpoIID/LytB domain-containing protein [Defluviitaleaceae bacterium]
MKMKKFFLVAALIFAMAVIFVPAAAYAQYSHVVRVGLVRSFLNRDSITVLNTAIWVGTGVDDSFVPTGELRSATGFAVRNSGGQIQLLSGGQVAHTFPSGSAAQIMDSYGGTVSMGAYSYRGVIEFIPTGGAVSAVNKLSLEEYLFGVLPAEMAPHFHLEALKAQAVAARTYTFRQIRMNDSHRAHPFDICDTTCCQVYRGAGSEAPETTEAVFLTYGLMLFYNNEPILANYFSSSGGATENSEDVWGGFLPYLRSVNEIEEHNPMVWQRTFSWSQITTAAANAGAGIGTVNGISISRLGASGRVLQLTLHGANGTWVVPPSVGVRGFFTPIGGVLPSRNFQIVGAEHTTPAVTATDGLHNRQSPLNSLQALDANGAISTLHSAYIYDGRTTHQVQSAPRIASGGSGITINGRGWGHGVGMSQMGAEGMARAGHSFSDILHHYYTGVELRWY